MCALFFFVAGFFASFFLLSQARHLRMRVCWRVSVSRHVCGNNEDVGQGSSSTLPELRDRTLLEEYEETSFPSMGHGSTGDISLNSISFQVLSWKPRALFFPRFAEPEQCQTIIGIVKKNLAPSTLMLRKGEAAESTFISAPDDKTGTLDLIEQKIAKVTMIPRSHGEAFNILRYQVGQKYDSHYDMFNPAEQKSQRDDNIDVGYDYKKCIGLKVKPKQGDALLFYSLFPNGTIDVTSLHGSCPVIKGEKWVATKWIRDEIDN